MNTVQYKCPNCGGELVFNPEKQLFSCPYCMSDFTEAEMEARYHTQNETAQKEADTDAKTLKDENDEAAFEEHTRLYECPSCGAQIIAEETTSATFCYYCHNPVVLAGRLKGNYKP
ncbi:MAG: TFIIB-type zinc ribbon-containing protein, partial [Ruminococcus sp.]|nr:TFIIB-type zinc ribbon-containing protein [Ruminococcus sp.]